MSENGSIDECRRFHTLTVKHVKTSEGVPCESAAMPRISCLNILTVERQISVASMLERGNKVILSDDRVSFVEESSPVNNSVSCMCQ